MVFNATFNSISVLSCWSVLLVEEIESHGQTLQHNVVSSTPRHERGSNCTATVRRQFTVTCTVQEKITRAKFGVYFMITTTSTCSSTLCMQIILLNKKKTHSCINAYKNLLLI